MVAWSDEILRIYQYISNWAGVLYLNPKTGITESLSVEGTYIGKKKQEFGFHPQFPFHSNHLSAPFLPFAALCRNRRTAIPSVICLLFWCSRSLGQTWDRHSMNVNVSAWLFCRQSWTPTCLLHLLLLSLTFPRIQIRPSTAAHCLLTLTLTSPVLSAKGDAEVQIFAVVRVLVHKQSWY
jgi:hypothetical protein